MDDDAHITCATYTHARRHPMVLGHIGGWTPPFQLSVTQILVIIGIFWLEMRTWPWWGAHLPAVPSMMIAVALPCAFAWVVRRTRIEGRSLPRAVLGWMSLLWTPRQGHVGGRAHREVRASRRSFAVVYVEPDDDPYPGGPWL